MRSTLLLLLMATIVGCAGGPADPWGPLAVMTTDRGMQARNEGNLVLTEQCAFLEREGERELLVWPSKQTNWSPETSEIAFTRHTGEVMTMRDGQRVVLGGGGSSLAEDGLTGEQWADRIEWVAAPDSSCLVDVRWLVSDVMPE